MGRGHGSVLGCRTAWGPPLVVEAGEANTDTTVTAERGADRRDPAARAQLGALLSGGLADWPRGPWVGQRGGTAGAGRPGLRTTEGAPGNTEPRGQGAAVLGEAAASLHPGPGTCSEPRGRDQAGPRKAGVEAGLSRDRLPCACRLG